VERGRSTVDLADRRAARRHHVVDVTVRRSS
jgi:hypothetical protein